MELKRGRLARRLTLLFILLAIIPLFIGGLVSIYSEYQFVEREIATRQQSVIALGNTYIYNYIDNIISNLKVVGQLTSKNREEANIPLETMCASSPNLYSELAVLDSQGQELANLINCRPETSEKLINRSEAEAFFRAKRGEVFVGNVSFVKDKPMVQMSRLVKKKNASEVVAIAVINLESLWKPLSLLKPGEGSYFYIVDRRGNLIAYKNIKVVGQRKNLASLPTVSSLINQGQGATAKRYVGLQGVEVIGTSTLVSNTNWGIIVEQPVERAFADPNRLLLNLSLLIGAISLTAVIIAILLATYIVRPINLLAQGAEAVSQGDLSYHIKVCSNDEIGTLARTFNQMTGQLKLSRERLEEYNRTLEARVEQRTEELRRSKQRLALLFQQTPLAVIECNTNLEITAWNPAAENIFGYRESEAIGNNIIALLLPVNAREQVSEILANLLAGFGQVNYSNENLTKDGKKLVCEWYNNPLIDSEGNVIGVALMALDITERKMAEEALREREEQYRSIFEATSEGLIINDFEGFVVEANPAACQMYGYTYEEFIGLHATEFLHPDDRQRAANDLQNMFENGGHLETQGTHIRKDGTQFYTEITAMGFMYKGKTHMMAMLRDITERKRAEEALRAEQEKSERLLLNILPEAIAQRLKQNQDLIADSFQEVTVLFADIVGFTELSTRVSSTELVEILNAIFSDFDRLADRHSLEKIKTIGDAYMVVGGLPTPRKDHAESVAEMALDMLAEIGQFKAETGESLNIRIGIGTGPVVAGVIGIKKFIYDLWGDTVNTASRMESHGVPGGIQVAPSTYELLRDKYLFEERPNIQIKGKGQMTTYLLTGRKSDLDRV